MIRVILGFFLSFAVVFGLCVQSASAVSLSNTDLYYYASDGVKTPLVMATRVVIRFPSLKVKFVESDKQKALDIVQDFSNQFSGIGTVYMENSPAGSVFILEFLPNTDPTKMLEILRMIAERQDVEAAPVFIVDNREAIINGIVVEPRLTVETSFVETEMSRLFPGATVRQVAPKGKTFSVFFKELFFFPHSAMPLSVLSLANIAHVQSDVRPWIKRAQPEFVFLGEAVSVSAFVEPMTGTIGQEREFTFRVTAYHDPSGGIVLDESLFPRFAQGSFMPLFKGTAPPDTFFKVIGESVRTEYRDERKTVITYHTRFMIYVPEKEWVIKPHAVVYRNKDGTEEKAVSNTATFLVLSHTNAGVDIADIDPVSPLPEPTVSVPEVQKPTLPIYWFDTLSEHPASLGKIGLTFGLALITGVVGLFAATRFPKEIQGASKDRGGIESFERRVRAIPEDKDFGNALECEMGVMFRKVFPMLPHTFSLSAIKDLRNDSETKKVLSKESLLFLLSKAGALDAILHRRFAPHASLSTEDMRECVRKAVGIAEILRHIPTATEEAA